MYLVRAYSRGTDMNGEALALVGLRKTNGAEPGGLERTEMRTGALAMAKRSGIDRFIMLF